MQALETSTNNWNRMHVFQDKIIFTGTNLTADPAKVKEKDLFWIQKWTMILFVVLGVLLGLDSIINKEFGGLISMVISILIILPNLVKDWRRSYQTIIPRSSITDIKVSKIPMSVSGVDIHFIDSKGNKRFRRITLDKEVTLEKVKHMEGFRRLF